MTAATVTKQAGEVRQYGKQRSVYSAQNMTVYTVGASSTSPQSVNALVAFPQVLHDLNKNLNWTTQSGIAYYNQPQDVLGAVQGMRQRSYDAGTLRPSAQLAVTYAPGHIVIDSLDAEVVYVASYNPRTV